MISLTTKKATLKTYSFHSNRMDLDILINASLPHQGALVAH